MNKKRLQNYELEQDFVIKAIMVVRNYHTGISNQFQTLKNIITWYLHRQNDESWNDHGNILCENVT